MRILLKKIISFKTIRATIVAFRPQRVKEYYAKNCENAKRISKLSNQTNPKKAKEAAKLAGKAKKSRKLAYKANPSKAASKIC